MVYYRFSLLILLSFICFGIFGQTTVEGYAFESGNRGFLSDVLVTIIENIDGEKRTALTDENGKYIFEIKSGSSYSVKLASDLFEPTQIEFSESDTEEGKTLFLSHEMRRLPGYIFEITLAEKNKEPNAPKNSIKGALVEVYNNTKEVSILVIEKLTRPDFRIDLKKGNHYTILVRHPDYLTKRMEAFVDVEGCILCFEGVGDVRPGVSDNLTQGNSQGTLLANVEMEKYYDGKIISLSNIYYDYNDYNITSEAAKELEKVAIFINDNPNIKIELSSHTDSRGRSDYNKTLSQNRSESAVSYLLEEGHVNPNQMSAQGYGEGNLINKCKNGIKCIESDHAVNRRTELKLLKIAVVKKLKSLVTMKREERFEKMLKQIRFGGSQIRVSSEEELPTSEGVDSKTSSRVLKDFENNELLIFETVDSISINSINRGDKYNVKDTESEESTSSVFDISTYSGYKFVIHFSRFDLPETNKIFKNHDDIFDFVTKDNNHLYMVGDYDNRKRALEYLKGTLLKEYSNAYLVGFKNGIRVE